MATFKGIREALFLAHDLEVIDEEEFLLLSEMYTSKNLDIPYWKYQKFDLDLMTDDECKSEFRFYKHDVYSLIEVLDLPEKVTCPNRFSVYSDEAVCMLLKRFAYPCRYEDLVSGFARTVPQISMVVSQMTDLIFDKYSNLLSNLDQPRLAPAKLCEFADVVHQKGSGTVRPVADLD